MYYCSKLLQPTSIKRVYQPRRNGPNDAQKIALFLIVDQHKTASFHGLIVISLGCLWEWGQVSVHQGPVEFKWVLGNFWKCLITSIHTRTHTHAHTHKHTSSSSTSTNPHPLTLQVWQGKAVQDSPLLCQNIAAPSSTEIPQLWPEAGPQPWSWTKQIAEHTVTYFPGNTKCSVVRCGMDTHWQRATHVSSNSPVSSVGSAKGIVNIHIT